MRLAFVSAKTMLRTAFEQGVVAPLTYPITSEGVIIGTVTLEAREEGKVGVVVRCKANGVSKSMAVYLEEYSSDKMWVGLVAFLLGGAYWQQR